MGYNIPSARSGVATIPPLRNAQRLLRHESYTARPYPIAIRRIVLSLDYAPAYLVGYFERSFQLIAVSHQLFHLL